jgi:OmpA-OmpF porin, OOP family
MKKFLVAMLMITLGTQAFAQKEYKRPAYIGVSFIMNDYLTAQRIRTTSFANVINNKQRAKFNQTAPGLAITYSKGLRNLIDMAGTAAFSFPRMPKPTGGTTNGDKGLIELDASLLLKMFSDKYIFTPYISAGLGASRYDGRFDAILPLGLGAKFDVFDESSIFFTGQYRVPVTNFTNTYHFMYGIGFAGRIGEKPAPVVKEVIVPQAPKDTDGDGITDDLDKCPEVPGVARYNGCPVPDTDKDGINDEEDKCPTVPGTAKYNGCPIPDTDLDGINDEEDKCPTVKGLPKYAGCPVPDTDGDGVNDEEDRCPTVPGIASNFGCPEIKEEIVKRLEYAAQRIYFATGSAKLLSTSFKSLDDVVKVMNEDLNLKLSVEGHTDNVGKDEYNQTLSESRAASVREYLVNHGVNDSRIVSQGFGETKPIADNKTAAGRAKNRRVVLTVSYQ